MGQDLDEGSTGVISAAAYPGSIDRARLSDCRDLRRLQVLASLLVGDHDEPSLRTTLVTHLDQRADG